MSPILQRGATPGPEHQEVGHGATLQSVHHIDVSSRISHCIWPTHVLGISVVQVPEKGSNQPSLCTWLYAPSPELGGQGRGHKVSQSRPGPGSAMTGSLVPRVHWGHAQQPGSAVRSLPAHLTGIGNSTPQSLEEAARFLFSSCGSRPLSEVQRGEEGPRQGTL